MTNRQFYSALIAGVIIALLIFGSDKCKREPVIKTGEIKEVVKPPNKVEDAIKKAETIEKFKFDSLQKIFVKSETEKKVLKNQLEQERANVRGLEVILNDMPLPDTSKKIVIDLSSAHEREIKIVDSIFLEYDKQIEVKENQLSEKDILYSKLRTETDTLVKDKGYLMIRNKYLEKQVKKKSFGSKFWKIVSVAEVVYILKTLIVK